jgi:uncharacterized protein
MRGNRGGPPLAEPRGVLVLGYMLSIAIGVSLGLLGGGGSILTVPLLHYVFGVAPHDAVAMSLVVVGATAVAALVPRAMAGTVNWRVGLLFGVASIASSYVGGRFGALLPSHVLLTAFSIVMIAAGAAMLARARGAVGAPRLREVSARRLVAVGLATGLLTGVLGAGGGFIIVPALTLFAGLALREAVATSLLVIAVNSVAGVAGTMHHATFDDRLVLAVTGFAIAGSFAGARIARRISVSQLQRAFAWFVIIVGVLIVAAELS